MKLMYYIIILITITTQIFAQSNYDEKIFHPYSGKFALSIDGGVTYSRTDFKNDGLDLLTRASLEFYIPTLSFGSIGFKAFGGLGYLTADGSPSSNSEFINTADFRTLTYNFGGGVSYNYAATTTVLPYLFGGISYFYFDPKTKDGNELQPAIGSFSPHKIMLTGETGVKFLLSENFGLNIAAGVNYINSDLLDGYKLGTDNDIFFHALGGLTYYFGGVKDTDGDGIRDKFDQCPETPPMVTVDEFGCPVDSDKDNVPDYADDCPNTPVNIPVDVNGCPVDSDKDGIADYLDLCKDTPKGVYVDDRGCPEDADDDGVPDFKDLCPNTPVGTEVNKWGCPIDEKVFEPIQKTEFILSGGINFEIGKADLLNVAFPELQKVLKVMNDYPDTKWKIEGHTDNTGKYEKNLELSKERALSVYNCFVSNGINKSRLLSNGYSSDYPIADNTTETGRALNRRVAIILISDENVKNVVETVTPVNPVKETEKKPDFTETRKYNPAAERNVGRMVFTDGYLYCFQVASFRTKEKADEESANYKAQGFNTFVVIANLPELDGTWYRVRVGYFNSLEEALKKRSLIIRD
ncbi:MAG: OmpA family protein [Ignavibacteriales bacterium]|nr:OmpA family protein [Ignavibacteriales bacterium]